LVKRLLEPTDCDLVATIAGQLNIPNTSALVQFTNGALNGLLGVTVNCCTVSGLGITCSGVKVTDINWSNSGLSGPFDMSNLPSQLSTLDISGNSITKVSGPSTATVLTSLKMNNNLIAGTIPSLSSQLTKSTCDISNNLLYYTAVTALNGKCLMNGLLTLPTTALRMIVTTKPLAGPNSAIINSATQGLVPLTTMGNQMSPNIFSTANVFKPVPSMTMVVNQGIDYAALTSQLRDMEYSYIYSMTAEHYVNPLTMNPAGLELPPTQSPQSTPALDNLGGSAALILYVLGALGVTLFLTVIASKVFKNPKIMSKFARQSSFGTLATQTASNKHLNNA